MKLPLSACLLALAYAPGMTFADDAVAVLTIAHDRGCLACHAIDGRPSGAAAALPVGPAWRDLARRYKSVKGAQQTLTAKIMTGSSPEPGRSTAFESHWGGQVSGEFMPSHRSAISEVEAARLVAWILALDIDR
jgi:cytochrome c